MAEQNRLQDNPKLSRQILVKVLLICTLFVAAATVVCYYLVYNQSREKHLTHLKQYNDRKEQAGKPDFCRGS